MNPQTCTKLGANRSSRLTASQDFWICDPLTPPPPAMPLGYWGRLVCICPFPDESAYLNQSANRSSRLTASRDFLMFDPLKPPKCPFVSPGAICLAYIHSQMNMHMCTKCVANRISRLTSSPDFWICDPLTPPPMSRGELYLAYDHSQTNPQTFTKFGANRCSRLTASQTFGFVTPKTPRNAPCVLMFNLFGIYPLPDESAHVCQMWCQSVQPFGSSSWICATLVQLLAIGRAVSRKNTPKNKIYTSKIIIPARTCRQQRH